jgi:hypothetical protein
MAQNHYPAEPVSSSRKEPRGSPLIKTKFELEFEIRFDPNLAKIISFDL